MIEHSKPMVEQKLFTWEAHEGGSGDIHYSESANTSCKQFTSNHIVGVVPRDPIATSLAAGPGLSADGTQPVNH